MQTDLWEGDFTLKEGTEWVCTNGMRRSQYHPANIHNSLQKSCTAIEVEIPDCDLSPPLATEAIIPGPDSIVHETRIDDDQSLNTLVCWMWQ